MLEIISLFIICNLSFLVSYYIFSVITGHEIIINKKLIVYGIIFTMTYIIATLTEAVKLKTILINVISNLMYMDIHHEKLNKTILAALINYILMMLSETVFTLVFIYGIGGIFTIDFVTKDFIGIIISNVIILLLVLIMIKLKFIRNIFRRIVKWYDGSKLINIILLIIVAFSLIAFFTYQNFIGIHSIVYFIEVNIALLAIFIFVIGYFNQLARNKHILLDYDQLMEYVKTYEKVLDEKSKQQHEYKNQLILVGSMVKSNDKKVIDYINKLVKIEDEQENYQYLTKLKNLPTGGLKGFIMYKIDVMLQKGIIPFIDISATLTEDTWKICENHLQDISRALGVYLDNAIEAACESENKYILLDAEYCDDTIIFTISNTYKGRIDFTKIDKNDYTTKGKGRGHGLALIKDIIDKNNKLEQYRELSGIYYVQKLIIKK